LRSPATAAKLQRSKSTVDVKVTEMRFPFKPERDLRKLYNSPSLRDTNSVAPIREEKEKARGKRRKGWIFRGADSPLRLF
jgi:hypothetical protein